MPDEVLSDGFAISARPVGTHALCSVEILGELDVPVAGARDVHCVTRWSATATPSAPTAPPSSAATPSTRY